MFESIGAVVIGISKDSCKSHEKFVKNKNLSVLLLSDEDVKIQKAYDVWKPKKFMGKEFLGTIRSTFLINPEGKIIRIWYNISALGHAQNVLDELEKIIEERK